MLSYDLSVVPINLRISLRFLSAKEFNMPAITSISVNDSSAVPHTFTPTTTDGSSALWENRASGTPSAYERLGITVERPARKGQAQKIRLKFTRPFTEETSVGSGVYRVVRQNVAEVVFNFSNDSLAIERLDDVTMVKNLLGLSPIYTAIQNIEPHY